MLQSLVTAALSIAALTPSGVAVAADARAEAEQLRRMDIMLMVTGLRCRASADNFIDDYGAFTSSHMGELNAASSELKAEFAREFGLGASSTPSYKAMFIFASARQRQ